MNPKESATTIDWFRFRTQGEPLDVKNAMAPLFGDLSKLLTLGGGGKGILGFEQSLELRLGGAKVGRLDFGGKSQRGWVRVDVPGTGCDFVTDWDAVGEVERLPKAQIRRLDLAVTTWRGEVGHEDVVKAHEAGKFTTRGRPPELRQVLSSNDRAGRTCYVGRRDAPKFFRGYDKGFELLAKLGGLRAPGVCTHIDGFPVEGIYRCELELKATEGQQIPFEAVLQGDQYFVGAYPYCAELLPTIEPEILQRDRRKAPQRELQAVLSNCRMQFGNSLYTALKAYQGDIGAVWDQVVGKEDNQRLVDAGVLLFDDY